MKQVASAVSLSTDDGKKILGEQYNEIDFIREDSVLSAFLNAGKLEESSKPSLPVNPIFPFDFNNSQKLAVENALNNKISIIEGPPGTGKTQTILNIIDKLNRRPILVVEVDGYAFHVDNARQIERDKMKDAVLMKYQIPVLRFRTNESDEEKRLVKELREILHSTRAGKGRMINEELQRQTPDS